MTAWRKFIAISLPAVLVTGLLAALGIEIWVRATWNPKRGKPGFYLSDAVRGQRLASGYDGWFAGVPVHINSLELRDSREYALTKAPNTFRILVLGDSVTFGHGAVHAYPELLERRLRAWRPDVDWQVWNAGVPGYNTSNELAHLLEVGPRFAPDLVIVGFFENDLADNRPIPAPGRAQRMVVAVDSWARRHLYSYEFYKRVALQVLWRYSADKAYRERVDQLGSQDALFSSTDDATTLAGQAITPYARLTDDDVAAVNCVYGMKASDETVPAMQRAAGFGAWLDAVHGFQRLARDGSYRLVFFLNVVPPVCQDGDAFYDGGSSAVNAFFVKAMGEGVPTVSVYDEFLHRLPSQMPAARAHAFGNSNDVKAEVLFTFLRDRMLLAPGPSAPASPTVPATH